MNYSVFSADAHCYPLQVLPVASAHAHDSFFRVMASGPPSVAVSLRLLSLPNPKRNGVADLLSEAWESGGVELVLQRARAEPAAEPSKTFAEAAAAAAEHSTAPTPHPRRLILQRKRDRAAIAVLGDGNDPLDRWGLVYTPWSVAADAVFEGLTSDTSPVVLGSVVSARCCGTGEAALKVPRGEVRRSALFNHLDGEHMHYPARLLKDTLLPPRLKKLQAAGAPSFLSELAKHVPQSALSKKAQHMASSFSRGKFADAFMDSRGYTIEPVEVSVLLQLPVACQDDSVAFLDDAADAGHLTRLLKLAATQRALAVAAAGLQLPPAAASADAELDASDGDAVAAAAERDGDDVDVDDNDDEEEEEEEEGEEDVVLGGIAAKGPANSASSVDAAVASWSSSGLFARVTHLVGAAPASAAPAAGDQKKKKSKEKHQQASRPSSAVAVAAAAAQAAYDAACAPPPLKQQHSLYASVTEVIDCLVPDFVHEAAMHPAVRRLELHAAAPVAASVRSPFPAMDEEEGVAIELDDSDDEVSAAPPAPRTAASAAASAAAAAVPAEAQPPRVLSLHGYQRQAICWMLQVRAETGEGG